jgi:hypothetical protein
MWVGALCKDTVSENEYGRLGSKNKKSQVKAHVLRCMTVHTYNIYVYMSDSAIGFVCRSCVKSYENIFKA